MTHEELHARARVEVNFGLAWMLLDRANTFVRDDSVWPPNVATRILDMREKYVRDLMSMFSVSETVASAALEEAKGDISDATVLLMDDSSRRRLEAQGEEAHKKAVSSSPGDAVGGGLSAAQSIFKRLREMFPNASELELQNAVDASGGCQEVAEDILLDHCGKTDCVIWVAVVPWLTLTAVLARHTHAPQTRQQCTGDDGRSVEGQVVRAIAGRGEFPGSRDPFRGGQPSNLQPAMPRVQRTRRIRGPAPCGLPEGALHYEYVTCLRLLMLRRFAADAHFTFVAH
jgi:hypothetical protein